jgi:hypothetical protein
MWQCVQPSRRRRPHRLPRVQLLLVWRGPPCLSESRREARLASAAVVSLGLGLVLVGMARLYQHMLSLGR